MGVYYAMDPRHLTIVIILEIEENSPILSVLRVLQKTVS